MVERIKKARLIYNPTSGQEIIKKNIAEVLDVLEDVGYETSAYQTTPEPFSAQNEAERAAKAGFDLIIAAVEMVRLTKWSMGSQVWKIVRRWPLFRPVPPMTMRVP